MSKQLHIFIETFTPGLKGGGATRSVMNILPLLEENYQVKVYTFCHDYRSPHLKYDIQSNKWIKYGNKVLVYYASGKTALIREIIKNVRNSKKDLFYMNSFFDIYFSFLPIIFLLILKPNTKTVPSPRGELGTEALSIKAVRKTIFMLIAKLVHKLKNVTYLASSDKEKDDILLNILKPNSVEIIPNPITPPMNSNEVVSIDSKILKVVFFSRITPIKNLDYAINTLKKIKRSVQLDIYGNIENSGYWQLCQELLQELPVNIKYKYYGPLNYNEVNRTLANYHLYFLPTKGENFGHTIYEALVSGVPVLISDQTPWNNLYEHNAGHVLSLSNQSKFIKAIEEFDIVDTETNRNRVIKYATAFYKKSQIQEKYNDFFLRVSKT